MTSGAPWSVKGIDPKAREIAKDLARRSGMTLGEWLNQMIFVDGEAEEAGAAPVRVSAPVPTRSPTESRPPKRNSDETDRVLEALEDLSDRFDAAERQRAETSARFDAALSDLRADQQRAARQAQAVEQNGGKAESLRALEAALGRVAGHLQDGEARNSQTLSVLRKEMSQEVQRVAEQMNQKVQAVENRSADAIAQVGAEVTRVASVVEQRLRRADDAQAEALEKLGAEIARITERLSERIAAAERRSAQAIDDVGEQMARVTDRIHQRQERSSTELADRMRQSEERTAKLLEDAREKIERRLGKLPADEVPPAAGDAPASVFSSRWSPVEAAPEPAPPPPAPAQAQAAPAFVEPPPLIVEAPAQAAATPPPAPQPTPTPVAEVVRSPRPEIYLDDRAYLKDDGDLEILPPTGFTPPPLQSPESLEEEQPEGLRPSTRELIAAARAAARHNVEEPIFRTSDLVEDHEPAAVFSGPVQRPQRRGGAMRGVFLTSGAVASIGLAAAGYVVMHPGMMPSLTGGAAPAKSGAAIPVGPAAAPPAPPQQAMALTTPAPKPAEDATDAAALFADGSAKVDAGDASGVASLRTAANLGYAPAQRRLGKLFEDGGAGVQKDPAEGRRWTQRAATNGDKNAMHNLGLDYYEGVGGIKNMAVAAQWFQRAAELGLRDSQYNLARFYEAGLGVKQDLPAAYKWYLIAGRAGDTEAASRGQMLKSQLTPAQRAGSEQAAASFMPDPAAPPMSMTASLKSASPQQLALAQRALAKLGYYQGADDGAASQGLGQAIQAYQRDRGLAANGTLSPELLQTFANVSR